MHERDHLAIILQLIERIEQTVEGLTAETFAASPDAVDAVTYRLAMIGEHCKRLPDELRERYPQLPWREMAGMRNVVVHGYDNMSPAIVWDTAGGDLAPLREMAAAETVRLEWERFADERASGLDREH